MLRAIRNKAMMIAKMVTFLEVANCPMTFLLETNIRRGTRAKGSITLCKMLR